ncbi:MAG: beta-ribofuranosylaminobenzene 5'-phosphate synthase family protein [Geminicoccaceae bacterium]
MPGAVVRVVAPARLHLGFLDMEGSLGRRFGSLGLALEGIATRLRVEPAVETAVTGEADLDRADRMLRRLSDFWGLPPVRVTIEEAIPPHAGLGSGTQLALALGTALAELNDRPVPPREIARLLERGARSGIGIGAFEEGGFIMDGGRGAVDEPPPITARLPFPDAWRILLIFDRAGTGLHGSGEDGAFRSLPPYSPELAGRLCRLVLMQLLPGLATADLDAVGPAIGEIQREVGDYFAPAQNGRFVSPAVAEALDWLESEGIAGIGQSSWGPTGFAILPDTGTGNHLQREAERRFGERYESLRFVVMRGRNRGAEVAAIL